MQEQNWRRHCTILHCYTQCFQVVLPLPFTFNVWTDRKTSELHAVATTLKWHIQTPEDGECLGLKAAPKERRQVPSSHGFFLSQLWFEATQLHQKLAWPQVAKPCLDGDIYDIAVRAMTACDHVFNKSDFLGEHKKLSKEFTNKVKNNFTQEQVSQVRSFPSLVWLCEGLDICHSRMNLVSTGDYRATGQLAHSFCHFTCQSGDHQHRGWNTIFSPLISQKSWEHQVSV